MEDPIPNELDNALCQLIPAVMACGNPKTSTYLDLGAFEKLAEMSPRWRALATDGAKRVLDARVAGEVEVAFRHCMHKAAVEMAEKGVEGGGGSVVRGEGTAGVALGKGKHGRGSAQEPIETSEPLGYLSLALEFVTAEVAASSSGINFALSGLPMILLEDFLESQGREVCKELWAKWVEPNSERLTSPSVVQGGKYPLIRLCKKLAQRMSKTHDSSFCGKIHLFLSKALTFFERSGLNVTGGVNLDNVTAFEDEEQFRRAVWGFDGGDEAETARVEGGKTAGGGGGGGGGGASAGSGGDAMDVDAGESSGEAKDGDDFTVDYGLYQSFWRLQEYALKQDVAVKGDGAKDKWKAILHDVDKILGAFEANAFSEHDLRLAREKWAASSSASSDAAGLSPSTAVSPVSIMTKAKGYKRKREAGGTDAMDLQEIEGGKEAGEGSGDGGYFGLKYLTSSRLLRLQLRDPTLRLQVLTQWLILAASLKSKVGKDKDSPNAAADLNPRMERAKRLVKATPPRGEEYLNMLQTVLHRESAWTQWKDAKKCSVIEPVSVLEERAAAAAIAAGVVAVVPSYPNKRPRPHSSVALAERAKHAPLGPDFPLEQMVKNLRDGVPSSEEHLEDQRMCAEDSETPPSELPSASPLYTWRALRLLSRENPANLAGCYDGDLVKAMKRMDKTSDPNADDDKAGEPVDYTPAKTLATGKQGEAGTTGPEAGKAPEKVEATADAMAVDGQEEEGEVELKDGISDAPDAGGDKVEGTPAVAGKAINGNGSDTKGNGNGRVTAKSDVVGKKPSPSPAPASTATSVADANADDADTHAEDIKDAGEVKKTPSRSTSKVVAKTAKVEPAAASEPAVSEGGKSDGVKMNGTPAKTAKVAAASPASPTTRTTRRNSKL